MVKMDFCKPIKCGEIDEFMLGFVIDNTQPFNSEKWPKGEFNIYSAYIAIEEITWLGDIKIPKGRVGNLGPYRDMEYFPAGDINDNNHYTVGIMIEVLIYNIS